MSEKTIPAFSREVNDLTSLIRKTKKSPSDAAHIAAALVVLHDLYQCGVEFAVTIHTGTIGLHPNEVLEYLRDPLELSARKNDVSVQDMRAWNEDHYLYCAAVTKKGTRCKCVIDQISRPKEWVDRQGELCARHQDGAK
jgi:hypothetical protein